MILYSDVKYSMILYGDVKYSMILYSYVKYSMILYSDVKYSIVQAFCNTYCGYHTIAISIIELQEHVLVKNRS